MSHHHHSHPDYVPSVFSFGRKKQEQEDSKIEKFERRIQRMAKHSDQRGKARRRSCSKKSSFILLENELSVPDELEEESVRSTRQFPQYPEM